MGADFLMPSAEKYPADGRFPSVWQSLLWDLLPSRLVPDADGLLPPKIPNTDWIRSLRNGDLEFALSVAKSARMARQDSIVRAEAKASRLLAPTVTLLAACAALCAYQLNRAGQAGNFWIATSSFPAVLGIVFFMISALRSLDADIRVGFHKNAGLKKTDATLGRSAYIRECIRYEVVGEFWTRWTYARKATSLMQARAWFSRGFLCLVAALLVAATTQLFPAAVKAALVL
nr:hypothetical protein [Kibdelosporangium sp. MJ126-NF4]